MRELILDTETTGLDEDDRIIEIGIVEHADHMPTGKTYHWYINPQREISQDAAEVHGISSEFLRDKPVFAKIADEFLDIVNHDTLVMHNAAFDLGIINREMQRLGKPEIPEGQVVDTLELARRALPHRGRHTLESLCSYYRIDRAGRKLHSALDDAQLLSDVYLQLLRDYDSGDMIDRLEDMQSAQSRQMTSKLRRPEPLEAGLTEEMSRQHREYVRTMLGTDAVWYQYMEQDSPEGSATIDDQV